MEDTDNTELVKLAAYHALAQRLEAMGIQTCSANSSGVHIYKVDDLFYVANDCKAHDVQHEGSNCLTRHWDATVDGLPVSACETVVGPVKLTGIAAMQARAESAESKVAALDSLYAGTATRLAAAEERAAQLANDVCALRLTLDTMADTTRIEELIDALLVARVDATVATIDARQCGTERDSARARQAHAAFAELYRRTVEALGMQKRCSTCVGDGAITDCGRGRVAACGDCGGTGRVSS